MKVSVKDLLHKGAITECLNSTNNQQFLSRYFLADKSSGGKRFILNLKPLNTFIRTCHFKMENIKTVTNLVQQDCYMASIDLKDAYFLINVDVMDRKFLRFSFDGKIYEFTCLPFGLASAPYTYTKLLKPVVHYLRNNNITCVNYLDDFLIFGETAKDCFDKVQFSLEFLRSLGFIVNEGKSILKPSKFCKFLGFIFDSKNMKIHLPSNKRERIKNIVTKYHSKKHFKIQKFAEIIGVLVSVCPAVKYGWLYTKNLEREKYLALKRAKSYEAKMYLNNKILADFNWWLQIIDTTYNDIKKDKFKIVIFTDASLTGWGACAGDKDAHGWWSKNEKKCHINYLELKAIYHGINYFAKSYRNCNLLIRTDNTTALSYINRMGSVKYPYLNSLARLIWQWCEKRNIWILATYISSLDNWRADQESRSLPIETEWSLAPYAFAKIVNYLGIPKVDLFASKDNFKCTKYVSWFKDPNSVAVDAFTTNWGGSLFYAFPPFSLITRVLQKVITDRAEGIVVVPQWPSQPWYPLLLKLSLNTPVILEPSRNLLSSASRQVHPLAATLTLAAYKVSGKLSYTKNIHQVQLTQ